MCQGGQQSPSSSFAGKFCRLWIHQLLLRSLTLQQHLLHLCKVTEMQGPDEKANSNVTSSKPRMEALSSRGSSWERLWGSKAGRRMALEGPAGAPATATAQPQLLPSCTISH